MSFTIRDQTFVLVVNYLANEMDEKGLSCRLYYYGKNSADIELKQGIEAPFAIDAQFASLNELDHFLAIATTEMVSQSLTSNETTHHIDKIEIYKWHLSTDRFIPIQTIEANQVRQLSFHNTRKGQTLELITAEEKGPSRIFRWAQPLGKFVEIWSGHAACGMYPALIPQPSLGQPLEVIVASNCDGIRSVVYAINRIESENSDYSPLGITFTFLNNQRGPFSSILTVLDDDIPEIDESFVVMLRNPKGDCEISSNQSSATVTIRTNDEAFGVIEFADNSLLVEVDEMPGMANIVFLNVERNGGTFGRVLVRWQVSPPDGGYRDISPLFGEIVFEERQNSSRIQLSVPDDSEPEIDELAIITLEEIGPSSAKARIGEKSTSKVIILANDSPHGVIGWESTLVTAYEEPRDYRKTVFITRDQGCEGILQVEYEIYSVDELPDRFVKNMGNETVVNKKATPGADYVPVLKGKVTMTNGQKRVPVGITIIAVIYFIFYCTLNCTLLLLF